MLKEVLSTGYGAALIIKEKMKSEIKIMEENGKIKKEDAKNFLKVLENKGKEEEKKAKEEIKNMLKEVIDELGIATKKDLKKLKEELK